MCMPICHHEARARAAAGYVYSLLGWRPRLTATSTADCHCLRCASQLQDASRVRSASGLPRGTDAACICIP